MPYDHLTMTVEVDQSGRIEETNTPTILAFANSRSYCIRISAKEKRVVIKAIHQLHKKWGATLTRVFIFSTLLALLLKDHIHKSSRVIIDLEYSGYEPIIKDRLLAMLNRWNKQISKDQIDFDQIGKISPAHHLAIKVFRKSHPANREITALEVIREF